MFTLSPLDYLNWLIGIKALAFHEAVKVVEKAYERQMGIKLPINWSDEYWNLQ